MKLNEILGTEFPIIQGGMANIATGEFAAACSNAGALGMIATGGWDADRLRREIRRARELTGKPFGVNLMLMNPCAADIAQVILDEGTVMNIAVRPDCRRRGVAGRLLQVFLDFAQGNRLAFLTLEVRASNYAAIALYGSRGFRGVGRRKNYYEHPREDAVIMTLDLTGEQEKT